MQAILALFYLFFLLFFVLTGLVIAYHITSFALKKGEAATTLVVFLSGFVTLLVFNVLTALTIDWANLSLIPNFTYPGL